MTSTDTCIGRLGDMYGHKKLFLIGTVWYGLWSLIAGFSVYSESILFSICRGFQGIGPAFMVPNALAITGRTFQGMKKNYVVSLSLRWFTLTSPPSIFRTRRGSSSFIPLGACCASLALLEAFVFFLFYILSFDVFRPRASSTFADFYRGTLG